MHLPIHLDRTLDTPLQNQLFDQIRGLILEGHLPSDNRIIASRLLSEQLQVSRTTVLLVYDRLIAEGYLETRPAVGTFVCRSLPETDRAAAVPATSTRHVSPLESRGLAIDFALAPDPALFPGKAWFRIGQAQRLPALATIDDRGLPALRAAIADWLAIHRAIVADPEQILILSGVPQALAVAAALAGIRGRRVILEAPGEVQARSLFESLGGVPIGCPAGAEGIETTCLPEGPAALAYVTPARQRPLGTTLPPARRQRLLAWAAGAGAMILEDDRDGDFRFEGSTPPSLFSLDETGSIICLRGMAETLRSGTRLAYLVLPRRLTDAARRAKSRLDDGPPWLEQAILAEFISSGDYDRHLRRTRKMLLERRDALVTALFGHFGPIDLLGTATGSHVAWRLPSHFPRTDLIQAKAAARSVGLHRPDGKDGLLLLGYGALPKEKISRGAALLAAALSERHAGPAGTMLTAVRTGASAAP